MWTRKELKQQAKEALQRNYWKSVLVTLLLLFLSGNWFGSITSSMSDGMVAEVESPVFDDWEETEEFQMDLQDETIQELENENIIIGVIVTAVVFLIIFFSVLGAILVYEIFIELPVIVGANRFMLKGIEGKGEVRELAYAFDHSYKNVVKVMFHTELSIFLWSMLFVVPGVYKQYQYRMVEFILAEQPDLFYKEAMQRSKDMMNGEKWKVFVLDLSFVLWEIVSVMTCGIAHVLYVAPYKYLTNAALYRRLCGK